MIKLTDENGVPTVAGARAMFAAKDEARANREWRDHEQGAHVGDTERPPPGEVPPAEVPDGPPAVRLEGHVEHVMLRVELSPEAAAAVTDLPVLSPGMSWQERQHERERREARERALPVYGDEGDGWGRPGSPVQAEHPMRTLTASGPPAKVIAERKE